MPSESTAAYSLAVSLQPGLHQRYVQLKEQLQKDSAQLREYEHILNKGCASITMSLRACVYFIQKNRWMNVYEYVAHKTKATGKRLEDEIQSALGNWYQRRCQLEKILCFDRNNHYAALNIGGSGPERYGKCCILLDEAKLTEHCTCFDGDSLRRVFSSAGHKRLTVHEILQRFAVRSDLSKLAAISRRGMLDETQKLFSVRSIRQSIESPDSILEIHIHGPVLFNHVSEVVMDERVYNELWDKTLEFEKAPQRQHGVQHYDDVRTFKMLMKMRASHSIPFKLVER